MARLCQLRVLAAAAGALGGLRQLRLRAAAAGAAGRGAAWGSLLWKVSTMVFT